MATNLNLQMGARNGAKQERDKLDFYATHPQAVRLFLNCAINDGLKLNSTIWECACGNGHISEVLKEYGFKVVNSDIIKRQYECMELDFLNAATEDRVRLCPNGCDIMTNPPFKNAVQFVRKGLELLRGGFLDFIFKVPIFRGRGTIEIISGIQPAFCLCS